MAFFELNEKLKQRKQYIENEQYYAYCLFCLPGTEITLANELNNNYDYLIALPVLKMSHKSVNGEKSDVQVPLVSSYIFVYMLKDRDINKITTSRFHYRVLSRDVENGILAGQDLVYANWLFATDGCISVSEAMKINGRVKIINGPLKRMEGHIVQYSKRSRNCLIEIEFMSQTIKTWLPFEWVDAKV